MDILFPFLPSFTVELHSFYHHSFLLLRNFIVSFFIPLFCSFPNFFERFDSTMFLASWSLSDINSKLRKYKTAILTNLWQKCRVESCKEESKVGRCVKFFCHLQKPNVLYILFLNIKLYPAEMFCLSGLLGFRRVKIVFSKCGLIF